MPCGLQRTSSNVEKVANRGCCILSKRSPDQNIYNLSSKECQLSVPVLRNSEQRCIILTLVTPEPDAWKFLVPFFLLAQGFEQGRQLGSEAHTNLDGLKSSTPPPTIIFQVDLQKEQRVNAPEHQGSAESFSDSRSSGANALGQSRNRSKRTKSVKNSSSTSLRSFIVSNSFSGSVCDGFNAVTSDTSINNTPKVDNPVKRSSRKKGKKKGKQYKRSVHKKVSIVSETQDEESIHDASVLETSVTSDPACPGEPISQKMSEKVISPGLSVQDMEKDDSEENSNNDYTDNSATPMAYGSYNDEMDESEPIASLPCVLASEELSCNQLRIDEGSNQLAMTSSSTQTPEIILSTADETTADETTSNAHSNHYGSEISPRISFDQDNAPMSDSFVDKLKTDIAEKYACVETQSSMKDGGGFKPSEDGLVLNSRNNDTSSHVITVDSCAKDSEMYTDCSIGSPDCSKDVVDTDSNTERAQCSSQASNINDFHPVLYEKRGRLSRKLSGSSNGLHKFSSATIHGRTGNDINHSIWQKVQKNDKECVCKSKNDNLVPMHVDMSSKGSETWATLDKLEGLKQKGSGKSCKHPCSDEMAAQTTQTNSIKAASNDADSSDLLSEAIDGRLVHNFPEKLKRKPSSVSKQENLWSVKGLETSKINMPRPSKIHVQKKEGFEISMQVTHHQHICTGLGSPCGTEFRTAVVKTTDKSDCCQSESQQNIQINMEKTTPPGNICTSIGDVSKQAAQNEISSLLMASNSLEQTHIKVYSSSNITDSEDSQSMKLETESTHSDNTKLNSISGPVLQKWAPVGKKDSVVLDMSQIDNLTDSFADDSVSDRLNSNKVEVELPSSISHHFLPLNSRRMPCLSPISQDVICPSPEVDELTNKFGRHPCTMERFSAVLEVKGQSFSGFETDLCKIIQAVDESYKLQTASEGIHLVTGRPLADFERLLHSASPVLGQVNCISSCKICSPNQLIGDALCVHQIPRFSLGSLWQWYEKPGSYGLEVKVEDFYHSKRSRNGFSQFRAYFVPYLSAVQLFGRSTSFVCSSNGASNGEVMDVCEVGKTLKHSSYLCSLPIFSMLLPRPFEEADACVSKLSSFDKDEVCNKSVCSTHLTDGELLFEYFESDQPQQRRPLFEKIKELVGCDKSFNCQIFGDPLKLECLNVHDLHPASWYSVAWYPIYRIPDGNLRAAFLTYHSLGHFVHRSSPSNITGDVTHIVSPVVGLQSYNAKGECWFQPRGGLTSKVVQTEETLLSNSSEILKERLRTLEQTASVMSRASVRKGDVQSVNRQPDYEFFLSRRR